jgi:hypothetical protein
MTVPMIFRFGKTSMFANVRPPQSARHLITKGFRHVHR